MYYPFVRKALFQLDPERAHEVTFQQLRRVTGTPLEILVRQKVPARPVTCMGLTFKNPLGLAAGLDKNGECIDALGAMGFGSIEIGTVTPRPQPGNDKPRIFRLVDAEGLINRMGFNNHGVDNLVENVKKAHFDGVLGINIFPVFIQTRSQTQGIFERQPHAGNRLFRYFLTHKGFQRRTGDTA